MSKEFSDIQLTVDEHIHRLEIQVTTLLELLESLSKENAILLKREQQLIEERSYMLEKNTKVRLQVETMLERLRKMDV
jgi:uncharacterized protein (TIGR02449 family)